MKVKVLTAVLAAASFASCKKDDSTTATTKADFSLKGVGDLEDAELTLATSGIDPSKLEVKLYGFYVSENDDCSDMKEVYSNAAPEYEDMLQGVDYGDSTLADGTYKCVAYKIADKLKSASKATTDNNGCVADTDFDLEICRGNLDGKDYAGKNPDDSKFSCESGKEDIVTFYVSTLSISSGGSENSQVAECQAGEGSSSETEACTAFMKPTSEFTRRGVKLSDEIVKEGPMTGYIVIDGTGKIQEQSDQGSYTCDMQPPTFSFTAI